MLDRIISFSSYLPFHVAAKADEINPLRSMVFRSSGRPVDVLFGFVCRDGFLLLFFTSMVPSLVIGVGSIGESKLPSSARRDDSLENVPVRGIKAGGGRAY